MDADRQKNVAFKEPALLATFSKDQLGVNEIAGSRKLTSRTKYNFPVSTAGFGDQIVTSEADYDDQQSWPNQAQQRIYVRMYRIS